jgi:hypothetical protein
LHCSTCPLSAVLVRRDSKVKKDRKVRRELRDLRDLKATRDRPDLWDHLDRKVTQVRLDRRAKPLSTS